MKVLKNSYRQAVIVWVAMVLGVLICLLLVEHLRTDHPFLRPPPHSPEVAVFRYLLLGFVAATLFLLWFARGRILTNRPGETSEGPESGASRLWLATLATHALCETVAIFGLALFLLTRSPLDFYLYLILSLSLFAYFFPRYAQWEEWAKRSEEGGENSYFSKDGAWGCAGE